MPPEILNNLNKWSVNMWRQSIMNIPSMLSGPNEN